MSLPHRPTRRLVCVSAALLLVPFLAQSALAEEGPHAHEHEHEGEHETDEVIVITASPLDHDRDELAAAIDTLDREEIVTNLGTTIGETLSRRPGVATSGFAAGASRPVIRGQDAFRTGVVENGLGTGDVSTLSPDHGVPLNPLTAERIEVLRGPATLRYGGGSIAGVVNVITNRVPTRLTNGLASGEVYGAAGHNADERDIAASIDTSAGPVALHFDGMMRDSNDYDVPDSGVQPGSSTDANGFTAGASVIGESHRVGFAYSRFENDYAIPEAGEDVRIDMSTNRYRVETDLFDPVPGLQELRTRVVVTDYEHDEIADGAVGQSYENDEVEARIEVVHAPVGPLSGAFGLHVLHRDETFAGEALEFLAPTETQTVAGYLFEEFSPVEHLDVQAGLRIEGTSVEGTPFMAARMRERDFVPVSGSLALLFHPGEGIDIGLTGSAAQRAPSSAELFARGPHEATGTFEIGDPTLDEETAYSGELTARFHNDWFNAELATFITRYDDYVFGQLTGVLLNEDGDPFNPLVDDDSLDQLIYRARGALFYGSEISLEADLFEICDGIVGVDAQFDWVRARFTSGSDRNVPRITPIRWGGGVFFRSERVSARVGFLRTEDADQQSRSETRTSDYTFLDVDLAYRLNLFGDAVGVELFVNGRNLANETARNHVALNKDDVVLPGARVRAGVRASF